MGAGARTLTVLLALHPWHAGAQPAAARPAAPARRWPGQGDPAVEKARLCILQREAGGDYTAVDPRGRWFGAYQFRRSMANAAARRMRRPDLVGVAANRWRPEDQDAAFYVIYDRGRGRKAWAGGRFPCF